VARELDERGDELRVELAARTALELGERGVEPDRRPVAGVGGHAVDRVAERNDARLARNLGPGLPIGIAAAVVPLVVVVDDRREIAPEPDPRQHSMAEHAVLLASVARHLLTRVAV